MSVHSFSLFFILLHKRSLNEVLCTKGRDTKFSTYQVTNESTLLYLLETLPCRYIPTEKENK